MPFEDLGSFRTCLISSGRPVSRVDFTDIGQLFVNELTAHGILDPAIASFSTKQAYRKMQRLYGGFDQTHYFNECDNIVRGGVSAVDPQRWGAHWRFDLSYGDGRFEEHVFFDFHMRHEIDKPHQIMFTAWDVELEAWWLFDTLQSLPGYRPENDYVRPSHL